MLKWLLPVAAMVCATASVSAQDTSTSPGNYDGFFNDPSVASTLDMKRVLYQDTDPTADGLTTTDGLTVRYLKNSHAFTGDGCFVNKLINEVGVANAYVDMENITDDDLTNVATIAKGVDASVTVNPLFTVRDTKGYYAKGTTAGFCVVASGNSVLTLDIIKALAIGFYRDGKLIGTAPVKEGQEASGLTLSLVNIGTKDGVMMLTAEAPDVFDEISLNPAGGVQLQLASDLMVKYAFAGRPNRHIMNHDYTTGIIGQEVNHKGGITLYNELTGRDLKLDYVEVMGTQRLSTEPFVCDPEKGSLTELLVGFGCKGSAEFHVIDNNNPDKEVFPAGTEVGFDVRSGSLLNLGVGNGSYIEFYNLEYTREGLTTYRTYTPTEQIILDAGVLDVTLAGGKEQWMSAVATKPFSGAKLFIGEGVDLNLGATTINYAYIKEPPTQNHHCNLAYSSDIYLAKKTTSHQLTWDNTLGLPVKWSLVEVPEGSSATISTDGLLSGIDTKGVYKVRIQVEGDGHEDCGGIVNVHYDEFAETGSATANGCSEPLTNGPGENRFILSKEVYESSGSLLSISDTSDEKNIVDPDLDNYALYVGGLSIADNVRITGVKCANEGDLISDGTEAKRVGFVVEESVDGLNVKALEFLQIRCYYKAVKGSKPVYTHVIDESNAIGAQAIGTGKTTMMRYSIEVPAGCLVDEIQLWTSGVLELQASDVKIYYPFVSEVNTPCTFLLGCNGELVNEHATVIPLQAGGLNVAQVVNDTSNLVDDDFDSFMSVTNSVSVGNGVKVLVDLGRTIDPSNNVGIIMDDRTLLAGVKAGSWLKVKLHNTNAPATFAADVDDSTLTEEFTDWSVADAKVAGAGDKRALYFTPTKPFNVIELEIAGIAGVTDTQKYYGICTRGDADHNGVPDCMEEYRSPVSGLDIPTLADNGLTITLTGDIATASCPGASISRLLVYDMAGNAIDSVDGLGATEASISLTPGIRILEVVFVDGTARAAKLLVR